MNEDKIKQLAQEVFDENSTANQFAVSQTSYHTHNGNDSPLLSFNNLKNRNEFINFDLPGITAQGNGNYGVIFIAPYPCVFIGASEVHSTAETTSTTMTCQIEKLTGTVASGSGQNLLMSPFNLKATANTVQNATLVQQSQTLFSLNTGDRLGLNLTYTGSAPAVVTQVVIIIKLSY